MTYNNWLNGSAVKMAKVDIFVDENEFALYDYEVRINNEVIGKGENYRKEQYAVDAAYEKVKFTRGWSV